jgi:hypothetical protein
MSSSAIADTSRVIEVRQGSATGTLLSCDGGSAQQYTPGETLYAVLANAGGSDLLTMEIESTYGSTFTSGGDRMCDNERITANNAPFEAPRDASEFTIHSAWAGAYGTVKIPTACTIKGVRE